MLGTKDKTAAHLGDGVLHRAFSVFVFNARGELLLQKRSAGKLLWPGYWSNTCCSHPRQGELVVPAGERRLKEELGFFCALQEVGKFRYTARYRKIGSERELCSILTGRYSGEAINLDDDEVESVRWVSLDALARDVKEHPRHYTPWLKIELKKLPSVEQPVGASTVGADDDSG